MNVALIAANEAVFGVVGVPVQQKIYVGDLKQSDPRRRACRRQWLRQVLSGTGYDDASIVRVVASRNHGGGYLTELASQFTECQRRFVGSSSSYVC